MCTSSKKMTEKVEAPGMTMVGQEEVKRDARAMICW
jgi:hypothetical protein